ncbi:MAG TPA: hypothetical protein DCY33_05810 [Gemmatimonadetes bacterium]|nr:hypothetical protein [Gemmatimonadaceae bacterium]HAY77338.1 hypothetical protein [Gemmatimonadota bacterium]
MGVGMTQLQVFLNAPCGRPGRYAYEPISNERVGHSLAMAEIGGTAKTFGADHNGVHFLRRMRIALVD